MVEWLAGNRIRGTSTERTTVCGFNPVSAISGGWKELGRTTLGGTSATIEVSCLDDKRYYMILGNPTPSGSVSDYFLTSNGDTGSNYVWRKEQNGATDSSEQNNPNGVSWGKSHLDNPSFLVGVLANKSDKEKLMVLNSVQGSTSGAGTDPWKTVGIGKHAQTSNPINRLDIKTLCGSWASGSELVVLGWDPDDTHATNFWEELYSDSQTGQSVDNIDTGTFTNKKYLWVQLWTKGTGNTTVKSTFNNSTDSTYSYRYSNNGCTDGTATSQANFVLHNTKANGTKFINMFIVNDGTNEIIGTADTVEDGGSDASTDPDRRVTVFKRSTATAITDIEFDNDDSGSFTDWELKVWGSN